MLRDLILALSFTNMLLFNIWAQFFYKQKFYIQNFPTANSYLALIINELLITLVLWGIIRWLRRHPNPIVIRVVKFIVCLEVPCFIFAASDINQTVKWVLVLLTIGLICFKMMAKVTVKVILIAAPFVVFIFGQAVLGMIADWRTPRPTIPGQPAAASQQNVNHPRVIWILFDGTDYSIAFDDRPKGLELPEFDRLIRSSVSATHAYPPARQTATSIPALIDSQWVNEVECSGTDNLEYSLKGKSGKTRWGTRPNVFSDVRQLGFKTALVGEYLPYSRILGKDLDYNFCSAYYYEFASRQDTLLSNITLQLAGLFYTPIDHYVRHKQSNEEVIAACQEIFSKPEYGLIFVHSPIPHFPYINRPWWWGDINLEDGYNGNLRLADQAFGIMRRKLEKDGTWDNTTLIVSADHGFKAERVLYIVKLAGQKEAKVYQRTFNTIITRDLVGAILRNEIPDADSLIRWLDQHGQPVKINDTRVK